MPPMIMNETDFQLTMQRMYESGKLLYESKHYYNSCYLFGYVLESGMKLVLQNYDVRHDGSKYSVGELKSLQHSLEKLVLSVKNINRIPLVLRQDNMFSCPHICDRQDGYPGWHPRYRYGEHPMWDNPDWCKCYYDEATQFLNWLRKLNCKG